MKSFKRNAYSRNFLGYGFLLLICLSALTFAIQRHPLNQFDLNVAAFIQHFESLGLTKVMEFFSFIGSTKIVIIIAILTMGFLYFILGHRRELLFLVFTLGGAAILNKLMKLYIQRERPSIHRLIEETGYSFPSGHTMAAFALYGAIMYLLWRHIASRSGRALLIALSCFMILMIGLSRIYLGVHHPSDIIGALLASGLWFILMIRLYQWYTDRRKMRHFPV